MGFFKKIGKVLEMVLAPKLLSGAADELKRPANVLSENTKELKNIITEKLKGSKDEPVQISELLDGKARFRNIMTQNRVTPEMYEERVRGMYIAHWFYLIGYVAAFFWLFYLFFAAKEYIISSFFFLVVTTVYFQYSKRATEMREQEFLSYKEFFTYPSFWIPNTVRTNDYFEVDFEALAVEEEIEEVFDMTESEIKDLELFKICQKDETPEWKDFKEFMRQRNPDMPELQAYKKFLSFQKK